MEQEFADEAGDDESIDFSKVLPDDIFKDFKDESVSLTTSASKVEE